MNDSVRIAELEKRVRQLEDQVAQLMQQVGLNTYRVRSAVNVDSEIIDLIRSKQKINAVKRYRALHNVGLKEAKEAIDALEVRVKRGEL